MYPALCDVDVEMREVVTLPDGRRVRVYSSGYVEGDTNAYCEQEFKIVEDETDHELTPDEFNVRIEAEGREWFLHEFAYELAVRQANGG